MGDHTPAPLYKDVEPIAPVVQLDSWPPNSVRGPEQPVEVELSADQPQFVQQEELQPQPAAEEIAIDEAWDFSDYNSDGIENYTYENGRRYHAYQEGRYPLPNDESELDREDMKHHEWMIITGFRLHFAPISESPDKILDLGTGTGIWAIQTAEKYPKAEVIGIDLSPVQPQWVPPNLTFEIDDIEAPWLHKPDSHDFINVRFMFLAIKDYPAMLRQAFAALKPGGYIELSELDIHPQSYDSQFPPNSRILVWLENLYLAAGKMGFDFHIARKFKGMLEDAGFEAVTQQLFEVPWGGWPKDQRLKAIGHWHLEQLKQGLQGIVMGLFTRSLGWRQEEVEVFLVDLRKELNDKTIHIIDHAYVVYGRKPLDAVSSGPPQPFAAAHAPQPPNPLPTVQHSHVSPPAPNVPVPHAAETPQPSGPPEAAQVPPLSQFSPSTSTAPASHPPEASSLPPISQNPASAGHADAKTDR